MEHRAAAETRVLGDRNVLLLHINSTAINEVWICRFDRGQEKCDNWVGYRESDVLEIEIVQSLISEGRLEEGLFEVSSMKRLDLC